jgi:hypothetical protein
LGICQHAGRTIDQDHYPLATQHQTGQVLAVALAKELTHPVAVLDFLHVRGFPFQFLDLPPQPGDPLFGIGLYAFFQLLKIRQIAFTQTPCIDQPQFQFFEAVQ